MKKFFAIIAFVALACVTLVGCASGNWKEEHKDALNIPDFENDAEWENTMDIDFSTVKSLEELETLGWVPSPHGLRNYEYWCDQMVTFSDKGIIIKSEEKNNHVCDVCGVTEGVFTGGIETRKMVDGKSVPIWEQAFGYFEVSVIVPRGTGMWSAFWLQSNDCGKIGNNGEDGSEIDVYESSFGIHNPTVTGQAIHYDAYDPPYYRSGGNTTDVGYNLYDGKAHTYALKWSPEEYVMYVDGNPVWASNYGGVAKTPEFLRLTVEIRDSGWGPYSQQIGQFQNHNDDTNDFVIQSVKVYQNSDWEQYAKKNSDYKDMKDIYQNIVVTFSVFGGLALAVILFLLGRKVYIKKFKKADKEAE